MNCTGWLFVSRVELALGWLLVYVRYDSAHFEVLRHLVFLNEHLQLTILN